MNFQSLKQFDAGTASYGGRMDDGLDAPEATLPQCKKTVVLLAKHRHIFCHEECVKLLPNGEIRLTIPPPSGSLDVDKHDYEQHIAHFLGMLEAFAPPRENAFSTLPPSVIFKNLPGFADALNKMAGNFNNRDLMDKVNAIRDGNTALR